MASTEETVEGSSASGRTPRNVSAIDSTLVVPIPAKRRGKPIVSTPLDAVTAAALSAAAQHMTAAGFHGLAALLASTLQECQQQTFLIPSAEVVQQAARKAIADQPVWVHWSKQDMAPQFKCDATRLSITGAMRGYRMARASHGVSSGCHYFECIMLPGPSAIEILQSLPPNARLGSGLREQLLRAVDWEENIGKTPVGSSVNNLPLSTAPTCEVTKKRKADETLPPQVGGHIRVGWSMRTADLQAPVGYDKWSYGIRDIGGSIVHCSQRQDHWGGDDLRPGDVLGCAICFDENDSGNGTHEESKNHIRFFKNGDCMGQFVLSKGKREGGEAFRNILQGIYYPAISCYMGGAVRANFGPHWVCPPRRSRLPAGLKNLKPMSSVPSAPLHPDEAVSNVNATAKLFRKVEHQQALKDAVHAEAEVQCQSYSEFLKSHVEEIRQLRLERSLPLADLPDLECQL